MATRQQELIRASGCEVRFDELTRTLYATDASIYQIKPMGVAFPRSAADASRVVLGAAEAGVAVTPRGAGTGLAGGAVGDGLIIDFARYGRQITDLNVEARTVRVGAGVVLDQLNEYLKPHGLWFGPDVATSSRATLGGMIAANSSGARAPIYGTTVDHVRSLAVVLADGAVATVGKDHPDLPRHRAAADQLVLQYADAIQQRLPNDICKRWPGYGFDDYLRRMGDLTQLIGGSEGTLAGITSAELNLVPLPPPSNKGLAVFFFDSVPEAMQATVALLDLHPVAIEHIDRLLLDQTRGQLAFQAARSLMRLDEEPCAALLLVEFYDHVEDQFLALDKLHLGRRKLICRDIKQQELIWTLRKSGLTLLTACTGPAKPTPGIEDVCVRPHQLPDYVSGLMGILNRVGVQASYYGHAAPGLLHVRPRLNLHTAEDIAKYRTICDEVSALCVQFKGSLAGEHGVGITRTEYLPDHLGPELMAATRELKRLFDPKRLFNPGKIVCDGRYRLETNLRYGAGHRIDLPFTPLIGFVERDGSFVANLEQCNGCGGCRKDPVTMCPTYLATGEEVMSTRGRANIIRAALERRLGDGEVLLSEELGITLDNCLSCKACKRECPSNVDLAHLKADLNNARHQQGGVPLLDRMIANADLLGRLNCGPQAPIVNTVLRNPLTRWLMYKVLGFTTERPMPPYASHRFDRWFAKRRNGRGHVTGSRGRVILWDDTWVRYNEPNIGQAAVKVLEAAGFEVLLPEGRKCCGRPAMSRGVLDLVQKLGRHNVAHFMGQGGDEPIIFLEPSCHSMFIDDYRNLGIPDADKVAKRCLQFESFVHALLQREPNALPLRKETLKVAIHGHCHMKALGDPKILPTLAEKIPGTSATLMDTGCCGMAGAFGMLAKKYELSRQVAQPLIDKINALPPGTKLVASGTSCRHQITHLTTAKPLHMAELLAEALG
ncbi:MAG TPA: FAD-linked oxidase C-terminal domain-containing protein [Phycisphaerae bacterium]|nr:FAD-linked oxidase C-terminal domain-containing protein [Phycisphaerae bacterium]HSA28796.1 FAD-linked oxidase C-terminal domain-containing protein [Phycisphaerae bacterium]